MAGTKLTIKLTEEQQTQIKKATGKTITEINIDAAATGSLSDQDLDRLSGGRIRRSEVSISDPKFARCSDLFPHGAYHPVPGGAVI